MIEFDRHELLAEQSVDSFYERVAYWQSYLDALGGNTGTLGHDDGQKIVRELDAIYPYCGTEIYAKGEGIFPEFDPETDDFIGDMPGSTGGMEGMHKGVQIIAVDSSNNGSSYKIMHQVLISTVVAHPGATVDENRNIHMFLEMDAEIMPLVQVDEAFNVNTVSKNKLTSDELTVGLSTHSEELRKMLRSTTFRRLNRGKQKRVLDDFITKVSEEMNPAGLQFMGEPPWVLAPYSGDGGWSMLALETDSEIITGECLAVESPENMTLSIRAIRRDSSMLQVDAGLCLVIDPDDRTREALELPEEQILYIPLSGQRFEGFFTDKIGSYIGESQATQ